MALDKFNLSFKEKICRQNLINHKEIGFFAINIGYFMVLEESFWGVFLPQYAQNVKKRKKMSFNKW